MTQKDDALALFDARLAVFPLLPGEKIPPKCWHWSANAPNCTECGHRTGTAMLMNTRAEVEGWWTQYPDDNIGVQCKSPPCWPSTRIRWPPPTVSPGCGISMRTPS